MLGVERGGIYFHSVIRLFVDNKVYIICIVVKCVIRPRCKTFYIFMAKQLGDYPVSPFRLVSRLGSFVSTFISAPSLSETS